jgi:carboxyl-terminal processing protease
MFEGVRAQGLSQAIGVESRKLTIALYAVASLYVDSADVTKLTQDAITGMLEKLDPHSNYLDPEETREMNEPLQGNFDGIGIQFNMLTDTLYVVQVIAGGPSEKVGLLPGDRIVMVDDTLIAGVKMRNTDIQRRLRGPKGSEVRIQVLRPNSPQPVFFRITRGKIPVYSIDASYMADRKTGYIRLSRFAASSADEFRAALYRLKEEGMQNLILDLQGNGGGYLNIAIEIADELLGDGKLIVYTEGHNQPREDADATDRGSFEKGRLVVMVDESSASASEILAGAVQDWDRGIIIGRRTFGKGLVQKPVPLPDGSMIRLTVSRYYTPTGRCIQKPYENGDNESYNRELSVRYNHGELMSADSIHFPDSLKFNTLVSRRTVYGGGGVMPDIFVPIDTASYSSYHRLLMASGLINRVAMSYLDRNRDMLAALYPEVSKYKESFEVPETLLDELTGLAANEKIALDDAGYEQSKDLIKLQIKALIARDLHDISDYYQIINDDNQSFKAALRLINDDAAYRKELGS